MANKERKDQIRRIAQAFDKLTGGDSDFEYWEFSDGRYGLAMTTRLVDDKPATARGNIVITVWLSWDSMVSDVRLMFLGLQSQYANRKYGLRAELMPKIMEYLEAACIAEDLFHLYVKESPAKPSDSCATAGTR